MASWVSDTSKGLCEPQGDDIESARTVGYSIDDPVVRYMMDALAADRILGEVTPHAYAFADFPTGEETAKQAVWEAKGVVTARSERSPAVGSPSLSRRPAHSAGQALRPWP
jgi:hypothetical protein